MPAVDPELRRDPVALPGDPSGIAEAHDVLAAEEFAMPAPRARPGMPSAVPSSRQGRAIGALMVLLALALLVRLLRLLRRR